MKPQKMFIRLLALWLLAWVLTFAWAWRVVIGGSTRPWIDVAFGAVVILMLIRWTAQPATWLARRRVGCWVGWAFSALAALTGMLRTSQSFVSEFPNRFPMSLIYLLPESLDVATVEPVLRLRNAYQTGAELPLTILVRLALACSAIGMAGLATAIAVRVVWISLQPSLSPKLDALQARLPRLSIRTGRWLARLRWLLVAGLILSFVVSGLAITANARIPQIHWRSTTIGPDVPPGVWALALDGRNGTLYAGTSHGVFRSTDSGASWQMASAGLTGTDVSVLVLDGRDGTLYAGTWGSGVFRSTDGGASWERASAGLTNTNVRTLVLDGRNGTLYAGTGGGVFRSTDGGASWQVTNAGLTNTDIQALVLGERDGTLYAGTWLGGVFRSTDGGASWQAASAGLTKTNVWALALDGRDGTLYAGTSSGGVFRSTDGGASWETANAGLPDTYVSALTLDGRDGTLYAGTTGGGVFRSTDGGATWQRASAGLTNTYVRALTLDGREGTLYVSTFGGGVFRSTDGGASWQAANAGLTVYTAVHSVVLDRRDGTLYAGTWVGVFRSIDGGASWQWTSAGLTSTDVWALALDVRDGTLYAGTSEGVFRSTDGGASWQMASAGLTSTSAWTLALDGRDGILYAGTSGGVFRSTDGGANWREASTGLTNAIMLALAVDRQDGTLYAGTLDGMFRSSDGGANWQAASAGLTNTGVQALALDERDGTVYAGTLDGMFRSTDGGASWQAASAGLANTDVLTLALDERDGTLYAGTWDGGVFRSTDGGASWQGVSAGLISTNVRALALDGRDGTLYAGTSEGVFRSTDGGASWQMASAGLTSTSAWTLALDGRDGILYAGTWGGVFRSTDGGASWQAASAGLTDIDVRALALDVRDNTLYAGTEGGMFRSTDDGRSWQMTSVTFSTYPLRDLLLAQHSYGVVSRGPGESPVWATYGGGAFWVRLATSLHLKQATIRALSEGDAEVLTAWGGTLARAKLEPGYRRIPLAWLAVRALVWRVTTWATASARWLAVALALLAALVLAFTYANLARPFGLPLWATLLARRRLDTYARPAALETAWPDWEQIVRAELLHYGDATADDLRRVPGPFRRYALRRYAQTYDSVQALEASPNQLRLLAGDRLRRWQAAWTVASRELGTRPGLTSAGHMAVDTLATVLAEALGLTLGPARDFEAVRACLVEAPALRLRLPPRFPLVFVADPRPGARTVQMLVDAVDVLRETGYFAPVVPLEPPVRQLDVTAELRRAIDHSAHVHDFIVLGYEDVQELLIARQPIQALVQHILTQVDLTVVSPFVVSGPVPENMFFGREAEVRTLAEAATVADFAVVGNRKIGKTSLLQRARGRLAAGKRVRPLMVDCQTVRDAAGFFAAFQAQTDLELPAATPEGLAAAMTDLCQDGPPLMLLLDEVDKLLYDEQARGEPLAATWRSLAQAGACHFVFCGSTGLARRLDDPHSVFFNFPQPLPLGYLSPETARLVLTQPLETLGIILEDAEALLDEVLALTSGHPNFIQYLGRGLVEAANQRRERRILLDDLVVLQASTDFIEYYLKTVWGEAGPLERLITIVAPPDGFRLEDLETALAAHDVQVSEESLDTALKLLRIYSILEKHEQTYTFVPRAFPEILHSTQDVKRLIAHEKRRLAEGGA